MGVLHGLIVKIAESPLDDGEVAALPEGEERSGLLIEVALGTPRLLGQLALFQHPED